MKETLKLSKPIKLNEKEYKELKYDIEEIDFHLYLEAEKSKTNAIGVQASIGMSTVQEFDRTSHLFMGIAAIIACNKQTTFSDYEQLKGRDIKKVIDIGRGFFLKSDDSEAEHTED